MSDAFKCDGPCGNVYEGIPSYIFTKEYGGAGGTHPPHEIELCSDCGAEFYGFLNP